MEPGDRTLVQEGEFPDPRFDLRTDAAAAYGIDDSLAGRLAAWRARGYRTDVMTGLAWGHYQDYLEGRWDGQEHWDEAQCQASGQPRQHGHAMPYMVPSPSYAAYLESLLRRAIDAGAQTIFLEEPEFWSNAGYGAGFEQAWLAHHGRPYLDPAGSPAAFVQGAEVKYALYRDLIDHLCSAVSGYARGDVRCCVATHSLLNYAHNRIVSPMSSLRGIAACDGVILQVWSHTAYSPTLYRGATPDGLFAVAFLEYGSGLDLVRGTDRKLWFLADPVEDSPVHGWDRYRRGYETTVVASLMYPEVDRYEVMPWPSRVFTRRYPRRADGVQGDTIPPGYAQEVLAVANTLARMPAGPAAWDCGTRGIGVLVADSLMFRRGGPEWDDPYLSAFYGLALPPLFAGMPVRPVSMETLATAGVPDGLHALLLSYDGMTPPGPEAHEALAAWVRSGHALILFGTGDGPYGTLPGWWSAGSAPGTGASAEEQDRPSPSAPQQGPLPDLHGRLGLPPTPEPGQHGVGAGVVVIEPSGPLALAQRADGADLVRERMREALAALGQAAPPYKEQSYLLLRRGPYVVAAAPRDAVDDGREWPIRLKGRFVNLLDGELPVQDTATLERGGHLLLIDLGRLPATPGVIAASARIRDEQVEGRQLRFLAAGPAGTIAVCRIALPAAPRSVQADDATIEAHWDSASGTALCRHPNQPDGVTFTLTW